MILDQSAESAISLERKYRQALDLPLSPARTRRLDAIVEAARDAGVYRLFVALLDGRISPLR